MKVYEVIWRMPIEADTPEEAAAKALQIQRDPNSVTTVFEVDGTGMILALRQTDKKLT